MEPGRGYQSRQFLEQFQGRKQEMARPIRPRRQYLPVVAAEAGDSQPLPGSRETFGVVVGDSDQLDAIEALEGGIQAMSVAVLPVAPMTAAR